MTNNRDLSHRHLSGFVDWIKPESSTREAISLQAADIRGRISAQAEADGLVVIQTPDSGSFAKHTGLRRHRRGSVDVMGQDVDLPFVIKRLDDEGERIIELLNRFRKYADLSYPSTEKETTKSSVELRFTNQLYYDLVPMLQASSADYQVILKSDGTRRLTSVSKHTAFVRSRTAKSAATAGRVKFNECVRLMKWWRYHRIEYGGTIEKVSTILIELLCAYAFDQDGVCDTYTDTLHRWFTCLAHVTSKRKTVSFSDYPSVQTQAGSGIVTNQHWKVLDPVNATNNVVPAAWRDIELGDFADWFVDGRDTLARLISFEREGNTAKVESLLSELFGNAVVTHGAKP